MSLSPSYLGDTASTSLSPESPGEGDFSPRQFYDNLNSLEEHGTCDDKRDPIVNNVPDNNSSSLFNAQICGVVLPHFTEVRGLDGKCITLVSTQTQTDWEWAERNLSFSCQVQKEVEELELQVKTDIDKQLTDYNVLSLGLPRLLAYKPEPKQTPRIKKFPKAESEKDFHLTHCDYCQQLCQPFTHGEPLENETHFEKPFCCEQAKKIRALIQEERKKLALKEADRTIDVNSHATVDSEEEEAAKEQKSFVSQIKEVIKKFYRSGKCFLTLCPDGTGNVFYPSGKAAIIVSSAETDDFTHIILEDKDTEPGIKGIFTNKGRSTCYHPNGMIWLNLTPNGGLCFSESGDLRRRWNWLYFDPHVRSLPFKPLTFTLGPHISVRIYSQEHMYVTFGHQENTVRFSVGSKLQRICPESHDKPGQSVLERYVQMKNTEIYSLLDQMQTCMSHPSSNLHNIKPHYRFAAQKQRLSKQMEKEKSPEKIKAHAN
ncbi:uncharacterized protein [Leuresthes tenuis]|uniref:uncharacterized protein n=1 Tax=Leuresthes tenuis TaxID=355514 RepID=UPI003B50C1F1